MPTLTPEEQQELQGLHSQYGGQQGALSPSEQQELAQLHSKYAAPKIGQSLEDTAPDWLKNTIGGITALRGGLVKGTTLNNAPIEKLPGLGEAMSQHPVATKVGEMGGQGVIGGLTGQALGPAASLAGRVAQGGAVGGGIGALSAPSGQDTLEARAKNAGLGALFGTGTALATEAINPIMKLGKAVSAKFARMNPAQAEAYAESPSTINDIAGELNDPLKTPQLQDRAIDAIQNSRKALKTQGLGKAAQLRQLLTGKDVSIDPEVMARYGESASEVPLSNATDSTIEGPAANEIKQALQAQAKYRPGTVMDPVGAAKVQQAGQDASSVRRSIENAVPEAAPLNKDMQESMLLQEALRKGQKSSPISFVSTEAPDRIATLARAENRGAGGLIDLGNQIGAAKTMTMKDVGSGVPTFPLKALGRLGIRSSSDIQQVSKDEALRQFLSRFAATPTE